MIGRKCLPYTEEEKEVLHSFSPKIILIRILFVICAKLFFYSIAVAEFIQGGHWYDYLALFSYWSCTFAEVCLDIVLAADIVRVIAYYYNPTLFRRRSFVIILNALDFSRDGFIIATMVTSLITSGAFWAYYTGDWTSIYVLPYASLTSHTCIFIVVTLIWLTTTTYLSDWVCLVVVSVSLSYFCFIIYMYYSVNRWVYDQFNPSHPGWHITFIVIGAIEIALCLIMDVLNSLKNKLYVHWHKTTMPLELVHQDFVFGKHQIDYLRIELFTSSTFLFVLVGYGAFIVLGSMSKLLTNDFIRVIYLSVAFYTLMEVMVYFVTFGSIFYTFNELPLVWFQVCLAFQIMAHILVSAYGIYAYLGNLHCWVYIAMFALSMMQLCFRGFVLYYLWRSTNNNQEDDLLYPNYFD